MGHRYVFYIYPCDDEKRGHFFFVSTVREGKSICGFRKFDYYKIF